MKLRSVKFGAGPRQGIVAEYICEKCGLINNVIKAGEGEGDIHYEWPEHDEYRCFACEVELSTQNA